LKQSIFFLGDFPRWQSDLCLTFEKVKMSKTLKTFFLVLVKPSHIKRKTFFALDFRWNSTQSKHFLHCKRLIKWSKIFDDVTLASLFDQKPYNIYSSFDHMIIYETLSKVKTQKIKTVLRWSLWDHSIKQRTSSNKYFLGSYLRARGGTGKSWGIPELTVGWLGVRLG
jgi:hypothetical protein